MKKRTAHVIWLLALVVGTLVSVQSSASAEPPAYEKNYAVARALPGPGNPADCPDLLTVAYGCFFPLGDDIYIKDLIVDGRTAIFFWQQETGGSRRGECVNRLGAGVWGYCNKDFPEHENFVAWVGGGCDAESNCQWRGGNVRFSST